ncbi:hypothetical protein ES708_03596 [subsurface metagenome]
MRKLFRFITADVRMARRTELMLRFLLLGLLMGAAVCFLIIWLPLAWYGEVTILEPNVFVRYMEVILFCLILCFGSWMSLFWARRARLEMSNKP